MSTSPFSLRLSFCFAKDPQRDRVPRTDRPAGVDGRATRGFAGLREGHHPKRGASRLPPTTWTKNLCLRQKALTVPCYRAVPSIGRVNAPAPWLFSYDGIAAFRRWFAKKRKKRSTEHPVLVGEGWGGVEYSHGSDEPVCAVANIVFVER